MVNGEAIEVSGTSFSSGGDLDVEGDLGVSGNTALNGNVGIGTDSSSYALDVSGIINCTEILVNGAAIEVSGTGSISDPFTTNNGNVGIGTDLPSYALDVSGTINCTQILVNGQAIEVSGTTSDAAVNLDALNLDVEGNLTMGTNSSITVAGDLNIGVDASYVQSIPFTYKFLRIKRQSNPGENLVINVIQVWQNNENILENVNYTDNTVIFYDASNSIFDTQDVSNNFNDVTATMSASTSLTSIGDYAQITFTQEPNYDDLQAIYVVSPNDVNYPLHGTTIELLDSSENIIAESELLGESANYLMRGPVTISTTTTEEDLSTLTYKYLRFVRSSSNSYTSNFGAYEIAALQVWENDIDILTNSTKDATIRFYDASGVEDSSMNLNRSLQTIKSASVSITGNYTETTIVEEGEEYLVYTFTDANSNSEIEIIGNISLDYLLIGGGGVGGAYGLSLIHI